MLENILWFLRRYRYIFLLLLISVIVHLIWFDFNSLLFHGDWRHWPDENVKRFISGGYGSYFDDVNFGYQNIQIYLNFIFFLWGIIGTYILATKLTLLIPIALLSVITPYILIKYLTNDKRLAFISALFFSTSTILLKLELAHLFICLAFCLTPLIIYLFIRLLNDKGFLHIIYFSLVFSLGCVVEFRIMYIVSFILLLYLIFFLKRHFKLDTLYRLLAAAIIIILLNAFWIVPTALSNKSKINEVAGRGLFGDQYFNIFYSFANYDNYWGIDKFTPFELQSIPPQAWIIPLFVFSIFLRNIKNKEKRLIIFAGFVALLGILLTKQSGKPFQNLYLWLYDHFPGFVLFREASKFFLLVLIGYLILFAYSLKYFLSDKKLSNHKTIKFIFLMVWSLFFLWNTLPLMTGKIGWLFERKVEPSDYTLLNNYLTGQKEYFRSYWVPRDSQWAYFNFDKPKISAVAVLSSEYSDFYKQKSDSNYANFILEPFEAPYGDFLADISDIKYFIVPLQDEMEQQGLFVFYDSSRDEYIKHLDKLKFLKKVNLNGINNLKVYENKNYKPYIYTTDTVFNVNNDFNLSDKFNFINKELKKDFFFVSSNIYKDYLVNVNHIFEDIDNKNINGNLTYQVTSPSNNNQLFFSNTGNILDTNLLNNSNDVSKLIPLSIQSGNNPQIANSTYKHTRLSNNLQYNFTFSNTQFSFQNIIQNGSFENGLWQEKVDDCNNYDNNGDIDMHLDSSSASEGKKSLKLEVTRHIACNSLKDISVKENVNYLFSFDYQSPNARNAGYYIEFDDPNKTQISDRLPINTSSWQHFHKVIQAPVGAKSISVFIYAYEKDGVTKVINRYDNFTLIEVPDLNGKFFLVNQPEEQFQNPKSISFDFVNSTRKLVHVKSATTPFFLVMSEGYDPQWQLELNSKVTNSNLISWSPFTKIDSVSNDDHLKLNNFLNAWYVDTNLICNQESKCIKNSDGTYDIEMTIEFTPQRWFYLGSVITISSGIGIISLVISLLIYTYKKRKENKGNFIVLDDKID
jgi:hypothetical protein